MKNLASHIMDIVQNSIRAKAGRIEIGIAENHEKDYFQIEIRDDGTGMDEKTLARAKDPFFTSRTARKVGLGIALFQQNAERTGGQIDISSAPGQGTTVRTRFIHSHVDRPPLGDIAGTISLLIASNPEIHFKYRHLTDYGCWMLDTAELKKILDNIPPAHPGIMAGIRKIIRENLKEIKADYSSKFITTKQ